MVEYRKKIDIILITIYRYIIYSLFVYQIVNFCFKTYGKWDKIGILVAKNGTRKHCFGTLDSQ